MKLAISNIAWKPNEDEEVYCYLIETGVNALEIAPTRFWDNPTHIDQKQIINKRKELSYAGFNLVSCQALFYRQPSLKLFDSSSNRIQMMNYLKKVILFCELLGIRVLVFGSPKNRQKGDLPLVDAFKIAKNFFREAAEYAQKHGTCLCIEPNPSDYHCDFIQTTKDAVEVVQLVNHPGFKLNLDASTIIINQEDPKEVISIAKNHIQHCHISVPYLGQVGELFTDTHKKIIHNLTQQEYKGYFSIEMRSGLMEQNIKSVIQAVSFVTSCFLQ